MNSSTVALISLLFAAIYSCTISHAHPDKFWDWLNTLVASFLSFLLAMISGIWLYKKQNQIASESKRADIKLVLASELSGLHRLLTTGEPMSVNFPPDRSYSALVTFVQPLAIEEAARSSLFSPRDTENLLTIAGKVRMLQFKIDHFLGLVRSMAPEEYIAHATRNIEETRTAVISDIFLVSTQLQLQTRLGKHPEA